MGMAACDFFDLIENPWLLAVAQLSALRVVVLTIAWMGIPEVPGCAESLLFVALVWLVSHCHTPSLPVAGVLAKPEDNPISGSARFTHGSRSPFVFSSESLEECPSVAGP